MGAHIAAQQTFSRYAHALNRAGRYEAEIVAADEQFRMLSVITQWASVRPRVQGES